MWCGAHGVERSGAHAPSRDASAAAMHLPSRRPPQPTRRHEIHPQTQAHLLHISSATRPSHFQPLASQHRGSHFPRCMFTTMSARHFGTTHVLVESAQASAASTRGAAAARGARPPLIRAAPGSLVKVRALHRSDKGRGIAPCMGRVPANGRTVTASFGDNLPENLPSLTARWAMARCTQFKGLPGAPLRRRLSVCKAPRRRTDPPDEDRSKQQQRAHPAPCASVQDWHGGARRGRGAHRGMEESTGVSRGHQHRQDGVPNAGGCG